MTLNNLSCLTDIKHAFYINLLERPDRKIHVETQLKSIGINNFYRFNAIKVLNGALGCSMSHLKCLQIAKEENFPHILIVEDDIQFLDVELFINQTNGFFKNNVWDVMLLAGNNMPPYIKKDNYCVRVSKCQTTTGYLVLSHYYDKMIANIKMGINNLIKDPKNHRFFAIDKYWFSLQKEDLWYLIVPLSVIQREDYSDIEKKKTNYKKPMLDLDKLNYPRNQQIFNIEK